MRTYFLKYISFDPAFLMILRIRIIPIVRLASCSYRINA